MRSSPETRTGSAKNAGVFSAAVREEYFLNILQSFLITLSMYTVIPMPATEWNGRNLRYCMAFLPAAGFVISAAEWVLFFVCYSLHLSDVFFASFFCALPVLVTGKIHIDGLIDTCDALGSHGAREKKLQILDDPHAGAFGIAGAVVYFLLFFGVAAELYPLLTPETAAAVFLVLAASRAMAAAQIVTMRLSKQSGLLYTFRKAASGRGTLISSAAVSLCCLAAAAASFSYAGLIPGAAGLLFCLYFRSMAARQFGGISGDLCGWLIHMQELILLLSFLPALLQLGGMADFF